MRRRRQAEVDDLLLVLHYADLNSAIPADTTPGGETLGNLGGDGTPGICELAVVELGIARSVHTHSASTVVADALDLRHRLPHTWDLVRHLHAEVWVARRVASMSRRLSYQTVGLVDLAVADAITGHSPGRVIDLAAAKIIEADQAAHDARVEAERRKRYVGLTRTDATGLRCLIARITAGDAASLDTTVQQVADALKPRPEYADHGADELRAEALTWLARPDDVHALLAADTEPRKTRRTSVLYLHLSQAALAGVHAVSGVARVEGLGPHSLAQLTALLGHDRVILMPVIDLDERTSVHAYEHPEAIKERIRLSWVGDAFPRATAHATSVDIDHPIPYDTHGPPGQTNSHTGQPLSRTPHRAKTHLGYRCTPPRPANSPGEPPTDSTATSTVPSSDSPTNSAAEPSTSQAEAPRPHEQPPVSPERPGVIGAVSYVAKAPDSFSMHSTDSTASPSKTYPEIRHSLLHGPRGLPEQQGCLSMTCGARTMVDMDICCQHRQPDAS